MHRRRGNLEAWKGKRYALPAAAACTVCVALGVWAGRSGTGGYRQAAVGNDTETIAETIAETVRGTGSGSDTRGAQGTASGAAAETDQKAAGSGRQRESLLITVPDDTVFDQVGEDGTFVSSEQFYKIELPPGEWTLNGFSGSMDHLESPWGSILVSGYRGQEYPYGLLKVKIPETKEEYIRKMEKNYIDVAADMPEVVEYTYRRVKEGEAVQKETRYMKPDMEDQSGKKRRIYSLELNLTGPEYFYTVTARPRTETAGSIEEGRRILDSFRILDTSVGILKKIEEETFHGYYGKNIVMTNCLVLLEDDMSDEEIGQCLEATERIARGLFGLKGGDALAARREDSPWLGIDCPSLQQNCTKENAKKVSKVFKSDVILYDEFDGDLLMVAYCDKEQRHAYERAAASDQMTLQSEFGYYGEEQEFPEDLLQYMDLTAEEAEAIWKDEEAVFQMDKWYELTRHMTKMPVPEELIGMHDYKDIVSGFEVIRS